MFFINNRGNQKDIYKYTMKEYSNAVMGKDLTNVASVDMIRNSELDKEIQKFILDIYVNREKRTYKEKVKYLKKIHDRFGIEELLYGYIYYSNYILNVQLCSGDEIMSQDDYNDVDKLNLIHSTYLLCLVFNNDLLNYKIEGITESNGKYRIDKSIKKELISIHQGATGYYLTTTKNFDKCINNFRFDIDKAVGISGIGFYYNIVLAMAYKDNFKNYFDFSNLYISNRIYSIDVNVLRDRKFLIPNKGVIIKITDDKSEIESIYLNEVIIRDLMFIVGCVRYRDGEENNISFPLNIAKKIPMFCRDARTVMDYILAFYKIEYRENDLNMKYEVISPYYWKYKEHNYESNSEKESSISEDDNLTKKPVYISSYIRNITGNPSDSAKQLAKKMCINLKENQTIVTGHMRNYNFKSYIE